MLKLAKIPYVYRYTSKALIRKGGRGFNSRSSGGLAGGLFNDSECFLKIGIHAKPLCCVGWNRLDPL